ncbi:MAG: hypothetical protein CMM58_03505 [Rhodospirillaceae bacterium]|nr:hypothetical protein [Rhodospirillaceae bacterium]|tara:strand:+ start:86 stop:718 length:633 start_codon:yes stop_codon:yes gene_type:complete
MARGLLIAAFDFSNVPKDEFHDWYDLEHIPEREAVPGFGACERWIGVENINQAVATYDLDDLDVLNSSEYKSIAYENLSPWSKRVTGMCDRILRFEGTQILPGSESAPTGANGLLMVAINVAQKFDCDFNAWYDEEHIPNLINVPGVLAARRYKSLSGTHTYVAIYHLEKSEVTNSPEWSEAINTPWSSRIRPHFENRIRVLAEKYNRDV